MDDYKKKSKQKQSGTGKSKQLKVNKQKANLMKFSGIIAATCALSMADYYQTKKETMVSEFEQANELTYKDIQQKFIESNPVVVEIDEMLSDYKNATTLYEVKEVNEIYKGKYIEITGEINKLYLNSMDGDFITLDGNENSYGSLMTVECRFVDKNEIQEVREYEPGDEITIQGYCVGSELSSVVIKNSLVK